MNALWTYFWPAFAAGLVIGAVAGLFGFRRRGRRAKALAIGIAASIAAAALWHGPLGAADRFTARVERGARQALDYYEMTKVSAHLHRAPLTRTLILAGPADDFQTQRAGAAPGAIAGREQRPLDRQEQRSAADRRSGGGFSRWASFLDCCSPIWSSFAVVTTRNGLGDRMDFIRDYWWLILLAAIAIAIAFILLRPRQRVKLTDSAPTRPHMAKRAAEGRGLAGEAAAATSDVTGDILRAPVRNKLDGAASRGDDLCLIKGIGPKFEDALNASAFTASRRSRISPDRDRAAG